MLAAFNVLLAGEVARETPYVEADDLPPERSVGGIPGWTFDVYSREGRAALQRFLQGGSRSAGWIRSYVHPSRRTRFLGDVVFRVEGGLLSRRLRWPLADELRRRYQFECLGTEPTAAAEALTLVREDLPALNAARAASYGSNRHVR